MMIILKLIENAVIIDGASVSIDRNLQCKHRVYSRIAIIRPDMEPAQFA